MLAALLFTALFAMADADNAIHFNEPVVTIWPNGAPGSPKVVPPEEWNPVTDGFHRVKNIHNPTLTVFLPKVAANGAAFVILPGGGHNYLVMDLEGANVAHRLNQMGIAAFVLKSRLAHTPNFNYKVEVESLQDAQRAIRTLRSRAKEWNLNSEKIGIMGFSAGGEIGALAETRFDQGHPDSADPVDHFSSRPDVAVLGYPGVKPATTLVPKDAPPTFLVVNNDDNLAPASAEFYLALRKAGVAAELLIFNRGGHGFGMTGRNAEFAKLPVSTWPDRLQDWLKDIGFIPASPR
jgi:acetyl esterase/lipase